MSLEFSRTLEEVPPSGIRRFFDLVASSKEVISLGVGEPDFVTPWCIREEAIASVEKGLTSYTSNSGLPECRREIATYLKNRFGCSYSADTEIIITNGVSEGVDITLRTLLNPGDEVILPEPNYVCYAPLIHLAGGQVVSIDTSSTGFIPNPEAIEAVITPKTKAIVLCSPNNPTGAVIPKAVLYKIAQLAQKYDFWVISDEIYAELTYDEAFVSFGSFQEAKDRTVLMNGFSKAFAMTGWRLGYLCAPTSFINRAVKIHQYAALCAPIMAQYAGIEALKNPKIVEDMRRSYEARRNLFVKRLNTIGLDTFLPQGAFYCFPSIQKTGLSSEAFAIKLLESVQVAVVPGSVFGQGGEGYIRCCYATHVDLLKEALQRIQTFVNSL